MINLFEVIDELEAKMVFIRPLREGAEDLGSIDDLRPDTKAECQSAMIEYQRQLDTLDTAKRALRAVLDLGYPEIPKRRPVSPEVNSDILENLITITKASAEFFAPAPEAATIVVGEGIPTP